ncbi:hypothetical protein FB451DRAFT_1173124 [Mycena latifolia]|nr:hypothetical protein FB451DRAFT_1173124 [Mycena latifolia]
MNPDQKYAKKCFYALIIFTVGIVVRPDRLDWENPDQYLTASSPTGSDGNPYEYEESQLDEMVRQFRRREARKQREAESPPRTPRASAVQAETSTKGLYASLGPLDSQVSSQLYVENIFHEAGLSIHKCQPPLERSPERSPPSGAKLEPDEIEVPGTLLSEVEHLQEELRRTKALLDTERGRFFTLLERATQQRDRYREEARKWEAHAEKAVGLLRQAQSNLEIVLGDLECGV